MAKPRKPTEETMAAIVSLESVTMPVETDVPGNPVLQVAKTVAGIASRTVQEIEAGRLARERRMKG